jgi:ATP adenylyltransferase
MDRLYAPWRSTYSASVDNGKQEHASADQCVFCMHAGTPEKDNQNFILRRFEHTFIMLNLYPYNAGHLMVLPYMHTGKLQELSLAARTELMELTSASTHIVQEVLGAHGVNIGMNIGKAAGAGIPSHIHMHVLPRWTGDTNFLPTLSDAKQISFDLTEIYSQLKPSFDAL